jgi:hypothetical protein
VVEPGIGFPGILMKYLYQLAFPYEVLNKSLGILFSHPKPIFSAFMPLALFGINFKMCASIDAEEGDNPIYLYVSENC